MTTINTPTTSSALTAARSAVALGVDDCWHTFDLAARRHGYTATAAAWQQAINEKRAR